MVYCFKKVYYEEEENIEMFINNNQLYMFILRMDKKRVGVILLILALVLAVVTIFISLNIDEENVESENSFSNSNSGNIQLIVEGGEVENAKG